MVGHVTYLTAHQIGMASKAQQLPCADETRRAQSPKAMVVEEKMVTPKEPIAPPPNHSPTAKVAGNGEAGEAEASVPHTEKLSLPPYRVITHSLKYEWVLWGLNDKAAKRQRWTDNLSELGRFSTVEDFWLLFDSTTPVGKLSSGNDYFLFKAGIMPSWEHPANGNGGRWVATIDYADGVRPVEAGSNHIDAYWMEVVKACVGAQFGSDGNEALCGAVASLRMPKPNRVALWIRDAKDEQKVARLGGVFKEKLNRVLSTNPIGVLFESHYASHQRSKRA